MYVYILQVSLTCTREICETCHSTGIYKICIYIYIDIKMRTLCLQEVFYFVGCGDKIRSDDVTVESTEVKIADANNEALGEALITGPMDSGMQPATRAATESGEKDLLESLHTEVVEKKKEKKEKGEKTEKAEPKTLEEPLG